MTSLGRTFVAAALIGLLVAGCEDPVDDAPPTFTLQHWGGGCPGASSIGPSGPEEYGHWAATRLEAQGRAYAVERVEYNLEGGVSPTGQMAGTTLAHRVQLFRSSDGAPPATPVTTERAMPSLSGDPLADRTLVLDLAEEPYQVGADETLFVSIELVAEGDYLMAVAACPETTGDRAYWSNATDPPFAWEPLSDFGLLFEYQVRVQGRWYAPQ